MGIGLTGFARRFLINEAQARAELTEPVLVWEAPQSGQFDESVLTQIVSDLEDALVGSSPESVKPTRGEPLVFVLKPRAARPSVSGDPVVLLGRTDENDISLPDPSVSRVHASFHQDRQSRQWKLMDVGSTNGTWVGHSRLPPNQPALLTDRCRVRAGNVELVFYQPASFFEFLRTMMDAQPGESVSRASNLAITSDELDALVDFYLHAVRAVSDLEGSEVARKAHAVLRRLNLSIESKKES